MFAMPWNYAIVDFETDGEKRNRLWGKGEN